MLRHMTIREFSNVCKSFFIFFVQRVFCADVIIVVIVHTNGVCFCCCQATRHQTVVKLKLVSCAPVVEVLIKRPHVKYQLGFSVQNGVVSYLLAVGCQQKLHCINASVILKFNDKMPEQHSSHCVTRYPE